MLFRVQKFCKARELNEIGEVGKYNHLSVTNSLSSVTCVKKNYCRPNQTIHTIVADVVAVLVQHKQCGHQVRPTRYAPARL